MATIEISESERLALGRLWMAIPEVEYPLYGTEGDFVLGAVLRRLAFSTEQELTQELPGPEGYPNEFVPSDFFS